MKGFAGFFILAFCATTVRSVDTNRCFDCKEERSPPIKEPACNQTTSCGELSYKCFAQVVKKANGNIEFSKGCASGGDFRCGNNPEICRQELGSGAEACKTTCCSTKECNVSFPELNGGNDVVLGVMPMIVSMFFALTFL
ncbi:Hypothetical predicted protein [Paramuricea clavata]|uniref:Uncharacterized protein n=1 Tax=Paramuricea clavata TaxID=317549 RepID=A0A7D9E170_PARCT|nr:Hypothetical predicted protein [Paramuricea clavata]